MRLHIDEGVGYVLGFGADLAFAGSQLDHAFPETDGSERSQKDTKAPLFEFRRPKRSRQDTPGHATETVRDREAPGSNPGPPTRFSDQSLLI
jgi:hypothetical protein